MEVLMPFAVPDHAYSIAAFRALQTKFSIAR
jgi:hypothetical protein